MIKSLDPLNMSRMLSSKYGKPSSHGPCHSYFLGFLGSDSLGQFWNPRLSMDWCKICKEHLEERIVVTLKIPEIYRAPDPVSILRSSTSATLSLSFSLFVDGDIAPLGTPPEGYQAIWPTPRISGPRYRSSKRRPSFFGLKSARCPLPDIWEIYL